MEQHFNGLLSLPANANRNVHEAAGLVSVESTDVMCTETMLNALLGFFSFSKFSLAISSHSNVRFIRCDNRLMN